ncbi:E3 ubiquitin-protein ligase MBR2-like [Phragmites australis]|uniref:E3 ubiquitin-protein ligase MBR2-like n=1 Tax=Phragmites australis TaxID=29695 RepID=UPI002D799DA2|nr:E3 ubiquitin-protein ligase MBR2-like [Phragmites australis]
MDETMGRRTVGGLLLTKGGSILVFREDSPRHKATACCTRLGCSSKLFPNKDRKMHRKTKEPVIPRRSLVYGKSNKICPQGRNAYDGSTSRNAASTCGEADSRPRRENAGRDLLARLKERVNASRKRSLSGGSSPSPPSLNTSSTSSSSSSRSISRSLHRPASRMRKDGGRNAEAVRMHRDSSGSSRVHVGSNADEDPSGRFLSRRLFRHRSRFQGGPISSLEYSLDDSNENYSFDMDESEEVEDYYVFNDRHRGMRMDIDDMSYEELLALGERIGTVSTGLSDGALSECLKRSLYVPTTSISHEDGDIKCIICQEEYFSGVEVAKMVCKHYYHITCIQQWLRQRNWCPICKSVASAVSS